MADDSKQPIAEQIPTVQPAAPRPRGVPDQVQQHKMHQGPQPNQTPVVKTEIIYCFRCQHWNSPWPDANVGDCMLSRKYGPTPHRTTDLTTCSKAQV